MTIIRSIGLATPTHAVSQQSAAELLVALSNADDERARFIRAIHRRSGVDQRSSVIALPPPHGPQPTQDFFRHDQPAPSTAHRMARYATDAPVLATAAARAALTASGTQPSAITHLITASCTGFGAPGLDIALVDALTLSPDTTRTHIGFMGCHAAINAVRIADATARASPDATVLLVCAELCSLHLQVDPTPDQVVSNALFSDGAAALVVTPDTASPGWRIRATASHLIPDTRGAMSWRIGDVGFQMSLAESVPAVIREQLAQWLLPWLARFGIGPAHLPSLGWAIHPGGPKVLDAVRDSLTLPESCLEHARRTLRFQGNMSSPTVLFILDDIARTTDTTRAILLAFGPGLTIEAALLERVPGRT